MLLWRYEGYGRVSKEIEVDREEKLLNRRVGKEVFCYVIVVVC